MKRILNFFRWLFSPEALPANQPTIPEQEQPAPIEPTKARIVKTQTNGDTIKISKKKVVIKQKKPKAKSTKTKKEVKK